ncbi:hypothetical protein DCCM_4561 [Desulfocucumis palustris]|uniref:Uncharacterized protein n=1 Tax=Desulfocucumis palustris TaxID=1898651 RepID=A0A2L2XHG5_9FIRM|nr:hypothetical protein [Desulfocucumis palustris]GBF35434.1 hypothetical protein DCCM_4561 [Desulfocucumis palustris]
MLIKSGREYNGMWSRFESMPVIGRGYFDGIQGCWHQIAVLRYLALVRVVGIYSWRRNIVRQLLA